MQALGTPWALARILSYRPCAAAHPGAGARAGVATAFASPIGGLLFTIEEGASFYSTSIFWRGFLSTGIGVLTLHFLVECAVRAPCLVLGLW
jgi:H+/Cl- antiporter ClcA